MKRILPLTLAAALALAGTLLALAVVNLDTDRLDRLVMIFCFAGAAALVGLASSVSDPEPASSQARQPSLADNRSERSALPVRPTALVKQVHPPTQATPALAGDLSPVEPPEPAVADTVAPDAATQDAATQESLVDAVDAELQQLIDDDQMQEINALIAEANDNEAAIDLDPETDGAEIVHGLESVEPLARLELRLANYSDDDLRRVVKESEAVVIAEMVRTGQLTSEGTLTERDIASMVFLAYTSEEMLTDLRLRKSAAADAPNQDGRDALTGSDFAPLKNIE